ncbi:hypothetical protein [Benzoatithermus flavus]|uniref:Uncharacterized protein n=1 Tax=Benzoatithermus flavus TaxID=3108223 RepID=A0ABU8XSY8_9PROT
MLKSGGEAGSTPDSGEEVGCVLKSGKEVGSVIMKPLVQARAILSEQGRAKGVMNHVALIDFDVRYADCSVSCQRLGDTREPAMRTSYAGRTIATQVPSKLHIEPGRC